MAGLARLSLRHPRAALGLLLAATALLAAGLPRLATDVGYRAFLGEEHPSVREFDAFLERFGGGLPMAAVWSCRETPFCESVFDPASLEMAGEIARALERSPAVRRVASPATTPLLVPTAFGPLPRRFVEGGAPLPDPDRRALAERALVDPGWLRQLVSADGQVGAVVSSESRMAVEAHAVLESALAPFSARGARFYRVGGPVEFVVAGGELETATTRWRRRG